jgi:hypothetical protein
MNKWNDDFDIDEVRKWYNKGVAEGERKFPNLKDRYCPKCGWVLVRGSIGYDEGWHFDGCPTDEDN